MELEKFQSSASFWHISLYYKTAEHKLKFGDEDIGFKIYMRAHLWTSKPPITTKTVLIENYQNYHFQLKENKSKTSVNWKRNTNISSVNSIYYGIFKTLMWVLSGEN